jgi:hypothetical protein
MLVLLGLSSAVQAVDNVQSGYAGADAGDWGGANGAVIGHRMALAPTWAR